MRPTYLLSIVAMLGVLASPGVAQNQSADWLVYNGDFKATRFSPLTEITKSNAAGLKRTCAYDTDESTAFQTGPIVVQGVLYFTTYNCDLCYRRCDLRPEVEVQPPRLPGRTWREPRHRL